MEEREVPGVWRVLGRAAGFGVVAEEDERREEQDGVEREVGGDGEGDDHCHGGASAGFRDRQENEGIGEDGGGTSKGSKDCERVEEEPGRL